MNILLLAVLMASAMLCSCSDDKNEPEKPTPEERITDVLKKDMSAGSISQEDFESKVMNKVWYYSSDSADDMWVDVDGNRYAYRDYALTGWHYNQAYYFDNEKYVDFRMQGPGQDPVTPYHRVNREYSYNPTTGIVTAPNGFAYRYCDDVLFYIESVSDDEMIIHDSYIKSSDFPMFPGAEYNLHSRRKLKAATASEAQRNWWNKYQPLEE